MTGSRFEFRAVSKQYDGHAALAEVRLPSPPANTPRC
jgi:hypothetical protein